MEFYYIALAGVLLHFLSKLGQAIQRKDFSWSKFFKKNLVALILGIFAAVTLIYVFVEPYFMEKQFDQWIQRSVCLVIGWSSSSILKNLIGMVQKAIDKRIKSIE